VSDIPAPCYSLIETSIGDDPAIVVINSTLLGFTGRGSFPWHLRIGVHCRLLGENGMPTAEEVEILGRFEETIVSVLEVEHNAIFLARITARGERVLLYRVQDPEKANQALQLLTSTPEPMREWEYQMEHDLHWVMANPELELLAQAIRLN